MGELLKEYVLYEELMRINNDQYFQLNFRAEELQDVFTAIQTEQQYTNDQSCLFFLFNLKAAGKKHVYLVLKWLIVTHQLLQLPLYSKVIEDIYRSLEQMQEPTHQTPFQTYLYQSLFKVYLHYLLKYCLYKLKTALVHHYRTKTNQAELFYMRVNLLKFGTNEFRELLSQFTGFFKENYPFLTNHSLLIEKDLKHLYQQLKRDHRRQSNKMISLSELEDFEEAIQAFTQANSQQNSCDQLLDENCIQPCKIQEFFLSNNKNRERQFIQETI